MTRTLILAILLCGLISFHSCADKEIVLSQIWETESVFLGPESIVYDSEREVLYVSNVNVSKDANGKDSIFSEFISKVALDGNIIDLNWIENINRPTGITIFNDQLYVTTRSSLLIIDINKGSVESSVEIPGAGFPNDLTVDDDGVVYITDSGKKTVYRIKSGIVENWIVDDEIARPNGILYDNGKIIIGVNSDNYLKSIDIKTGDIQDIAFLDEGEIDGISKFKDAYLVSHVKGNIYLVSNNGEVTELLNTREDDTRHADFGFIESKRMIISPVINKSKLIAYTF